MSARRLALVSGAAVGLLAAAAGPALAQRPAATPRQPMELAGGIVWLAPRSLGSVDATLVDANGSPVTLFGAENTAGTGFGVDVILSQAVARSLDVEVQGGWTQFEARTSITSDFEDVPDVTLAETLTRYSIEGAVLWRFAERDRLAWFLRASAGWMRETAGDRSLAENGWIAGGGLGLKYWLSRRPTGQNRFGIRAEMRVLYRRDGIALDDGGFRIWPAAAAAAVVRF